MADTISTLTQLAALLPDNKSGQISPQDIRDLMVSLAQIIKESGGAVLTLGPVADGELFKRSGTQVVGVVSVAPAVFSAEDVDNSSFTGVAFVRKLRLTFVAEAADYLLFFYSEVRSSDSGTRVKARIQQDDNTPSLAEINVLPDPALLTGYGPFSGFARVTLTAASHNFDIDFGSSQAGKTVDMRRARLVAIKVQ